MKAFVESQFGYCPLICMFHHRRINYKTTRIHERTLRITCKDKSSTFQELLEKDNSVSIHHRNVQKLAIENYKVLHGFSPPTLNGTFVPVSRPYNFSRNDTLQKWRVNSVGHGTESISFLGPKVWDLVISGFELSQSLSIFKRKIKKWVLLQCPCRLSNIYLQHGGFIHLNTRKHTARKWRRSFECFFDQCVNKFVCVCQFFPIDYRNSFRKDSISCSVTELTSITILDKSLETNSRN